MIRRSTSLVKQATVFPKVEISPSDAGIAAATTTPSVHKPDVSQLTPTRLPPMAKVRDLLHVYGLKAKSNLSQNFLLNQTLLRKLVRTAGVNPGDRVIEVGPGPGNLTREILTRSPLEVLALEKDRRFLPLLEQLSESVLPGQLKILLGDAMDHTLNNIFGDTTKLVEEYHLAQGLPDRVFNFSKDWLDPRTPPIRVIGNLPFSVSTALLIKWLNHISQKNSFWQYGRVPMLLTFQDEVARRICAEPSTFSRSRLSLMAQNWCHVDYMFKISGNSFTPRAGVDTGVVRFVPRIQPYCDVPFKLYEKFVRNLTHHRNHNLLYNFETLFPKGMDDKALECFLKARVNSRMMPYMISTREASRLCLQYQELCNEWPSLFAFDYRASKNLLPESSLKVLLESGLDLLCPSNGQQLKIQEN